MLNNLYLFFGDPIFDASVAIRTTFSNLFVSEKKKKKKKKRDNIVLQISYSIRIPQLTHILKYPL
jgi:hypothetical protein